MTHYVIDASVAIKWYVDEVYTDESLPLMSGQHQLSVPDLVFAKVGNILWKKARREELSHDECEAVVTEILSVPFEVHPTTELVAAAVRIALDLSRSVFDSLYLALAESIGCRMVTADDRLVNSLQGTALETRIIHVRLLTEPPSDA